jgi:hypothetical protein
MTVLVPHVVAAASQAADFLQSDRVITLVQRPQTDDATGSSAGSLACTTSVQQWLHALAGSSSQSSFDLVTVRTTGKL